DTPNAIQERQDGLQAVYTQAFPIRQEKAPSTVKQAHRDMPTLSLLKDAEIIGKASQARNGAKFRALFYPGDTSGYPSRSEADLALCSLLAFYTHDHTQIDRIFRESALCRDKWLKRNDYRDDTIDLALSGLSN